MDGKKICPFMSVYVQQYADIVRVECVENECMFWVEERHANGQALPAHCAIMHDIVKMDNVFIKCE